MVTGYETEFYANIGEIRRKVTEQSQAQERIASALERIADRLDQIVGEEVPTPEWKIPEWKDSGS